MERGGSRGRWKHVYYSGSLARFKFRIFYGGKLVEVQWERKLLLGARQSTESVGHIGATRITQGLAMSAKQEGTSKT